jgi:hypothetical protein
LHYVWSLIVVANKRHIEVMFVESYACFGLEPGESSIDRVIEEKVAGGLSILPIRFVQFPIECNDTLSFTDRKFHAGCILHRRLRPRSYRRADKEHRGQDGEVMPGDSHKVDKNRVFCPQKIYF